MLILDYDYEMDIAVQREEAERIGEERGIEQEKLKSAKKLKALGDDLEKIASVTGLPYKTIQQL